MWTSVRDSPICENPNNSANPTTAHRSTKSPRTASSSTNSGVSGSHSGSPSSTLPATEGSVTSSGCELSAAPSESSEDSAVGDSFKTGAGSPAGMELSPVGSEGEVTVSLADQGEKWIRTHSRQHRRMGTLARPALSGTRLGGKIRTGKSAHPTSGDERDRCRRTTYAGHTQLVGRQQLTQSGPCQPTVAALPARRYCRQPAGSFP